MAWQRVKSKTKNTLQKKTSAKVFYDSVWDKGSKKKENHKREWRDVSASKQFQIVAAVDCNNLVFSFLFLSFIVALATRQGQIRSRDKRNDGNGHAARISAAHLGFEETHAGQTSFFLSVGWTMQLFGRSKL